MHGAAGAPPQLTDGACEAAQSTGAAALRRILRARPLALRVHRERAKVDKTTDLCAADLHGGRARRKDNRGPRMLARMRPHRASCRPGGGGPSSPKRGMPRVRHKRGVFFRPSTCSVLFIYWSIRTGMLPEKTEEPSNASPIDLVTSVFVVNDTNGCGMVPVWLEKIFFGRSGRTAAPGE